ncbi:MAG TPA: hypothetical protein VNY29_02170 [Terriglobales bacterium]|nr:hypothetical protein [Terriglobales bacterium]
MMKGVAAVLVWIEYDQAAGIGGNPYQQKDHPQREGHPPSPALPPQRDTSAHDAKLLPARQPAPPAGACVLGENDGG